MVLLAWECGSDYDDWTCLCRELGLGGVRKD